MPEWTKGYHPGNLLLETSDSCILLGQYGKTFRAFNDNKEIAATHVPQVCCHCPREYSVMLQACYQEFEPEK